MKTDKKSLVPLFTFPPPLLAALFLLAGCHYKALQGMVWAIGVGHRARWRSPMFQTPWHAHTFTHTNAHTHSEQPHVLSLSHAHAHALRETHTHIRLYICALKRPRCTLTHIIHKHLTYVYTVHTHVWMYSTLTNIWGQTHNTHTITERNMHTNMHTRARTHTCTQGLGGTQARIVRVQKSYSVGN